MLWPVARQAPLSVGSSRQERWSGLPCPPPGGLPTQGLNPHLLCLLRWQVSSLPRAPPSLPRPPKPFLDSPHGWGDWPLPFMKPFQDSPFSAAKVLNSQSMDIKQIRGQEPFEDVQTTDMTMSIPWESVYSLHNSLENVCGSTGRKNHWPTGDKQILWQVMWLLERWWRWQKDALNTTGKRYDFQSGKCCA